MPEKIVEKIKSVVEKRPRTDQGTAERLRENRDVSPRASKVAKIEIKS